MHVWSKKRSLTRTSRSLPIIVKVTTALDVGLLQYLVAENGTYRFLRGFLTSIPFSKSPSPFLADSTSAIANSGHSNEFVCFVSMYFAKYAKCVSILSQSSVLIARKWLRQFYLSFEFDSMGLCFQCFVISSSKAHWTCMAY